MTQNAILQPQDVTEKTARKQGVSCDACKFRKVKCDRRAKLEANASRRDESEIACSICTAHGLRCTFTQSAPRRRRGKRIAAIQRDQYEDDADSLAQRSQLLEQSGSLGGPSLPLQGADIMAPFFGFDHTVHNCDTGVSAELLLKAKSLRSTESERSNQGASSSKDRSLSKEGLFGVRGLTRALLDACVRAYFKYNSPCQPIINTEVFSARYSLFFNLFEKYRTIPAVSPSSTVGQDDQPLSLLLILAVGCAGAAFLGPPIADPGSKAKFRLQDRLALKFRETLQDGNLVLRLRDEGADVVEACYVMSDGCLEVLGDNDVVNTSLKALDFNRLVDAKQVQSSFNDPLRLSASSAEAVARLMYKLSINRAPKLRNDCPANDQRKYTNSAGAFLTQRESFRRMRIFWSVFMQDSFRSFGKRVPFNIGDDDYDLDLPRLVPGPDGFFTALVFQHKAEKTNSSSNSVDYTPSSGQSRSRHYESLSSLGTDEDNLRNARYTRFDALQLEVMLRLAFIIRSVSIRFVSQRSQGRGVLLSDIGRAVSCLDAWWAQLPVDVRWSKQYEILTRMKGEEGSVSWEDQRTAVILRNSIKAVFIECLYHLNVLSVCSAVKDYGIRFEVDMTETINLLTSQIGLDTRDAESASDSLDQRCPFSTAKTGANISQETIEDQKRKAQHRLDGLLMKTFFRAANLARQGGEFGILRAHKLIPLILFQALANYGCGLLTRAAGMTSDSAPFEVPSGSHPCDVVLEAVEHFIYGLGTLDSSETAPAAQAEIQQTLAKARLTCNKTLTLTEDRSARQMLRKNPSEESSIGTTASQKGWGASESPSSTYESPSSIASFNAGKNLNPWNNATTIPLDPGAQPFCNQEMPPSAPAVLSYMDVDEVAMLARAAMPSLSDNTSQSNSVQPSAGTSASSWTQVSLTSPPEDFTSRPEQDIGNLYGPGLDLDLQALAGVDTLWLNQFLQNGQFSSNQDQPSVFQSPGQTQQKGLAGTGHAEDDMMKAMSGLYGASTASTSTEHSPNATFDHARSYNYSSIGREMPGRLGVQDRGTETSKEQHAPGVPNETPNPSDVWLPGFDVDKEMESFLNSAGDAQNWATTHWQGLSIYADSIQKSAVF